MRRFGETVKRKINYKIRIGVYGIIFIGNAILLTDQDKDEIQLPGGGVNHGEHKNHALVREVREETGWKINPIKHIGAYQRFVFMPEYEIWAHKICHIYFCKGVYQISEPLEKGHTPVITTPWLALKLLESQGDKAFLARLLQTLHNSTSEHLITQ